jgi:hypothetical protein
VSRLVEISPDGLGSVRGDVAATRDCIRDELGPLQWRMSNLDVPTGALHEALAVGNRLDTVVLPTLDWHVSRARELDTLRYHGSMGPVLPVVDRDDPVGPPAAAFTQQPWDDGTTALT